MDSFRSINLPSANIFEDSSTNAAYHKCSPSLTGDDKMIGDTIPCEEDTFFKAFDTQVVDHNDDSTETQPIDFDDETEIMELSGETQVIDDELDFVDHMDTQLLDVSNIEDCRRKSDREDAEGTQLSDNIIDSIDAHHHDKSGNITAAPGENGTSHQGSLRKGFASVRTASMRAAGLAARQTSSKNADYGSSSTVISSASFKRCPFDDHAGNTNVETVGVVSGMEKPDEEELGYGDKSDVVRSLSRKLFLEEDEVGSDDDVSDKREDMSQLPSCDKDMAGLSYVDSQEPGELSQANALEFVDKFLKYSVFESDQGVTHKNTLSELVSPGSMAKGAQSIAQQVSRRSTLAEGSIYEWDDNLEDEGGGEFFTKKKEELLGTMNKIHKSCPKTRSFPRHEMWESQSVGKLANEKGKKYLKDSRKGLFRDNMKSLNGGGKVEVKKIGEEKNAGNCGGQPLSFASGSQEVLAAMHVDQPVDIQDVGIDTQMAAEAIEALAAGNELVYNDCSMTDQGCQSDKDDSKKEAMKKGFSKQSKKSSLEKQACFSTTGVTTRSRTKRTMRTRSQASMGMFDAGFVYSRRERNRSSHNDVAAVDRRDLGSGRVSVDDKQRNGILEEHQNTNPVNPHPPFKRRSLRGRMNSSTSVVQETAKCIDDHPSRVVEAPDNSGERIGLQVIRKRKDRSRDEMVTVNSTNRFETLDQTTLNDYNKVNGSIRNRRDTEHSIFQDNQSSDKCHTLGAYGGWNLTTHSIATRTRSRNRTTQFAECPRDEKGKRLHECLHLKTLSTEDACQLSTKSQDACSPSVKGSVGSTTLDGSPGNMYVSANGEDSTPVNLKTPRSAVSPVCVGDGYHSPSCKKSLLLKKEFMSLIASENRCSSPSKALRQRRDFKNIRVLFSQHLDDDIIKQQNKILSRLGVSVASSISEATHFVADMFVRTRNMLEAIANAKPIVTHLWLESCGQANCFIDEKNYILRDASKEKELGFSMPKSLAHASQHPLLEGKRVLITPNVKPGKDIILSLVKAVHGQAVERLGRSTANDELFVLSCEEDFGVCVPLLEKGISVYSSELLLNGIITQRVEYERYRLFAEHVKRTRSTLWLNKRGGNFFPATKLK